MTLYSRKWDQHKIRYLVLVVSLCTYVIFYLNRLNLSAVLPRIIQDTQLSYAEASLVTSLFFITYALSQLFWGNLADRIGSLKTICIGGLLVALSNFLFGESRSLLQFMITQCINGWSQGAGWSPLIKLIANWFEEHERTTAMGLFTTAVPLSMLISYVLVGWLELNFGWPSAFSIPALMMLCITIIFRLVVQDAPKKLGEQHPLKDKKNINLNGALRLVLSNIVVWKIGVCYSFFLFSYWGIATWLPTYLVKAMDVSIFDATLISGTAMASGIISRPLAGLLVNKVFRGRKDRLIILCFIGSIPFVYLVSQFRNIIFLVSFLFVSCFLLQVPFPLLLAYQVELLPRRLSGTVTGFVNFLGQASSAVSMILTGLLLDSFRKYEPVFVMFSISLLLAALAVLSVKEEETHGNVL
jgi:sugar phosphate permease